MLDTRELSWSYTRHKLFSFCERKYYYHYFGSQNGWLEFDSTAKQEKIFKLKKALSLENWVKNIFTSSLQHAFITSRPTSKKDFCLKFRACVFRKFQSDKYRVMANSIISEPLIIKEIFLGKISLKESIDYAERKTNFLAAQLVASDIPDLLFSVPAQAKKTQSKPVFFQLDNIKVWNAPLIAWYINGKLYTLNLKIDNTRNSDWALLAAINTLYWHKTLNLTYDMIECITVFLEHKNIFAVYAKRHPQEVVNIIKDSGKRISSRTTHQNKSFEKNYVKTKSANCSECVFNAVCT